MTKRVIAVQTFDDFMRDLSRDSYTNTIVIVRERPSTRARLYLQKITDILTGMEAEVIFRTDITDAMIIALSEHIQSEREREFLRELMRDDSSVL